MTTFINRLLAPHLVEAHKYYPVIILTGPRQSGKTSLCRHLYPDYKYVNLEDITTRAAAISDPTAFLDTLGHNAIIDEVQNVPEILSMLQVRTDENPDYHYLLTGSSNFSLLQSVTQSLAGRAAIFTLLPFSLREIREQTHTESIDELMLRGQYPGVIARNIPATLFYRNYYNTYVERDLRNLLKVKNILAFDTFMRHLASRVGSQFNASDIARSTGVSSATIAEWLSILSTSYIAFPIRPYFANIGKQLTRQPKVYFYDTGLLCFLLGIETAEQLARSDKRGIIFENLAATELLKREYNKGRDPKINFFRENSGTEVDFIMGAPEALELYEVKSGETFRENFVTNMKKVSEKIKYVQSSTVIYNGVTMAPIAVNIRDI